MPKPSSVLILASAAGLAAALFSGARLMAVSEADQPVVTNSDRRTVEGDRIPPAELELAQGGTITVPAAGDGMTAVLFWATWSSRSDKALDLWQRFADRYGEQGLAVVTVNADHQHMTAEMRSQVTEYMAANGITLPLVMDDGLKLFYRYGVEAVPTVFFLDGEGILLYHFPSFPTSAELDLTEEVEVRLGLRQRETEEEKAMRGKLEYQPANNALLYYNLGVQLHKKGFPEKAKRRYIVSLQRDPAFEDPLRALEGAFYMDGRTDEAQEQLRELLVENGLESVLPRLGQGEPAFPSGEVRPPQQLVIPAAGIGQPEQPGQTPAPAATSVPTTVPAEKLTPMERMRLLIEQQKGGGG